MNWSPSNSHSAGAVSSAALGCQGVHLHCDVSDSELFVGFLVSPVLTLTLLDLTADSGMSASLCFCVDCPYCVFCITPVARTTFSCS